MDQWEGQTKGSVEALPPEPRYRVQSSVHSALLALTRFMRSAGTHAHPAPAASSTGLRLGQQQGGGGAAQTRSSWLRRILGGGWQEHRA